MNGRWQIVFSRHNIHSLLAIVVSTALATVVSVLIDGTGSLAEMRSYGFLVFSFVSIIWLVAVFPFVYVYNQFLRSQARRRYFPIISMVYAVVIFYFAASLLLGLQAAFAIVCHLNILVVTAALIGAFWGLLYLVLYVAYSRKRCSST